MLNAALYRTRITHLRRAPVHHYFEHRGYSWYVDIDDSAAAAALAAAVRQVRRPRPLSTGGPNDTLRHRVDAFLAERGIDLPGGRITALLQARVLGYVFNPLSLYWCHDADGVLRHVVAEVHNTYGGGTPICCRPTATGRRWCEEAVRLAVQRGRRLLPGARPLAGRRAGRDDLAAPRQPAGVRRHPARHQATGRHRRDRCACRSSRRWRR